MAAADVPTRHGGVRFVAYVHYAGAAFFAGLIVVFHVMIAGHVETPTGASMAGTFTLLLAALAALEFAIGWNLMRLRNGWRVATLILTGTGLPFQLINLGSPTLPPTQRALGIIWAGLGIAIIAILLSDEVRALFRPETAAARLAPATDDGTT